MNGPLTFSVQMLENLDYKQPMTVKNLLLPSTATFYSIFEVSSVFFVSYNK